MIYMSAKPKQTKGASYYKNPYDQGKKFDAAMIKESKDKFFRTFHRTKSKAYMTTFDDVQFVSVLKFCLNNIVAGDPATTFDLIIDKAWEQGAQTGNIKDLDSTQETAFGDWIANWLIIAWDVASQAVLRPFLAGVTESSTTTSTDATIAIWAQSDWDAFINSLERLECPDFVYRFIKPFMYVIRLTETYERAGIEIPPSYLLLTQYTHNFADLSAHREVAKGVSGNAMVHCKKFGIPFSKFSLSKLSAIELSKNEMWNNQDLLAFFGMFHVWVYDNTPTNKHMSQNNNTVYTGANLTTDFTNVSYPFIDGQPMSIIHALYPCFGRTIVNNARGEILGQLIHLPETNEYECNIRMMKLLGTAWVNGSIENGVASDAYRILCLIAGYYSSDATGALYWTGTKVTGNQATSMLKWIWYQVKPDIMFGTGVSYQEQYDSIDHAFRYMIYG